MFQERVSDYSMNLCGKREEESLMDVAEAFKHARPGDDVHRQVRDQGKAQLEFFGFVTRATQSL